MFSYLPIIITLVIFFSVLLNVDCSKSICQDCSQQDLHINFQGKVYLVIGESLKGKSSFIKDMTGQKIAIADYGTGSSCTKEIKSYQSTKNLKGAVFIDTVGLQRTDFIDQDEIQSKLQQFFINKFDGILSGIILIESYLGDTSSIYSQVQFISELFGKSVSDSIAIFVTKKNLITEQAFCKRKKSSIKSHAKKLGIVSKILDIQTSYSTLPSISHQENQIRMIADVLKSLKPIQLNSIYKRKQILQRRAEQLQQLGRKTHTVKQSCLTGDGHGLDIFNSKKHVDEVNAYFQQYPSIQLCRRTAKIELKERIRQLLLAK